MEISDTLWTMKITSLKLTNFRKHQSLALEFNKDIVIFVGNNASGKTSILEAISVLCNCKSSWTSKSINLASFASDFFRIEALVDIDDQVNEIVIVWKNSKLKITKNEVDISSRKYNHLLSSNTFSPEYIEYLLNSSTKRKAFLDLHISNLDQSYSKSLSEFKKILKHRNKLLKKLAKRFYESGFIDDKNDELDIWDQKFIELSTKLSTKRSAFCKLISNSDITINYSLSNGENPISSSLTNSRRKDIATGHSNIGAHRDDWEFIAHDINIRNFGSRGEKRMALAKMILNMQDVYKTNKDHYPFLLLDDVSSELDQVNTDKVFEQSFISKQQTFITTTSIELISKDIAQKAQIINFP